MMFILQAVITSNGALTPKHTYIADLRRSLASEQSSSGPGTGSEQKILILGSGYVSGYVYHLSIQFIGIKV